MGALIFRVNKQRAGYDMISRRAVTAKNNILHTRQQLLERLWDIDEKYVDEHTLTTSISRIRSKIEADGDTYIKTVYGMGYQWTGGEKK